MTSSRTDQPRLTARAERDLLRLPEKIAAACLSFVVGPLCHDPRRLGKRLEGELIGQWSARRGTYRIIYRVDDEAPVVEVLRISHRAHVYA